MASLIIAGNRTRRRTERGQRGTATTVVLALVVPRPMVVAAVVVAFDFLEALQRASRVGIARERRG
jgi:predicted transporter